MEKRTGFSLPKEPEQILSWDRQWTFWTVFLIIKNL